MQKAIHIYAIIMLITAFITSFLSVRIYAIVKDKIGDRPMHGRGRSDDDECGNPDVKISAIISAIMSFLLTIGSVFLIINRNL